MVIEPLVIMSCLKHINLMCFNVRPFSGLVEQLFLDF